MTPAVAGAAVRTTGRATVGTPAAVTPAYDWDNGNIAYDVVVVQGDPIMLRYINGNDASLVVRMTTLLENAWFDAIAPYHPTAVGIYSKLGRRPASEAKTHKNKNIALLYASYRTLCFLLPQATSQFRTMVSSVGMDPDDNQMNNTTPVGIGNMAAQAIIEARAHDGANQLGDVGGWKYNRQMYRDYTGYHPVNTAYELRYPSRWQPNLSGDGAGVFNIQQFVTPQFKLMRPFTYNKPNQFLVAPPVASDYEHNRAGYKAQADAVLARSAGLDDMLKMKAEVFDDKFLALGESIGITAANAHLDLDQWVQYHNCAAVGAFDAVIAVWYNKYHYDAVRPFSAIKQIYGDGPVTAWGGPGVGTVHDLPASQWRSYMTTANHPEYPSISTTLCMAHAQAARRFLGTDDINLNYTFTKGSSVIEPGRTPAQDLTVHFDTWTEFGYDCGQARINGGVHFPAAVQAGYGLGPQFGDRGYEFVMKHVNGTV